MNILINILQQQECRKGMWKHVVPPSPQVVLNVLLQSYLLQFINYLKGGKEPNALTPVYDALFRHLTAVKRARLDSQ